MNEVQHLEQLLQEAHRCRQERDDALRALNSLQRELADHQALTGIGTWRRDADSDVPVWSDQTYLIHGIPIGMPITKSGLVELIHEEDREKVRQTYDEAIAQLRSFRLVFRIRRPDGEVRVLHADNLVTKNPETGKVTIHGAVQDITDPSDTTKLLAAARGDFPANCLVVDLDGIVLRSNGIMRSMLAHSEPGGSVFRLFTSGDSHDLLEDVLDRIEADGVDRMVMLMVEGQENPLASEFNISLWTENERPRGFIIMPAHPQESQLAPSHSDAAQTRTDQPSRTISGAWEFSTETQESIWSEGMFDILCLDRNHPPLSIAEFRSMVHPDDMDSYQNAVSTFYETLKPTAFQFRIISKSGKTKNVAAHMEAVSRTGPNSHFFGTMTDITNQEALHTVARERDIQVRSLQDALQQMNVRLLEANLRLSKAQEEERSRIAVELHDRAGGLVTSLNLKLSMMEQDGVAEHLESARDMLDLLGQQVRQTTRQLRPNALNRFGIEAALKELAEDFCELSGLTPSLDIRKLGFRIDSRTATRLFRIAREAILNSVRHAEATTLHLEFGPHSEGVFLSVEDDGRGFNLDEALASDSMGLESMYDRADSLGGTLTITSRADAGTKVEVLIPIRIRSS